MGEGIGLPVRLAAVFDAVYRHKFRFIVNDVQHAISADP
jgi:hypothetical protein